MGNMLRKCRKSIGVFEDMGRIWKAGTFSTKPRSYLVKEEVKEACKALQYREPSSRHRQYSDSLFDLSCFVWFLMYSDNKRTVSIENLLDYVIRV